LITTVSISSSRKALLRQKRQFDNNFSGGVGSFQNCNRPGQCHSSGAIPNNQNVAQSGNNGGQGMFDNNFSGGVGSFQNCNRPGQCHASGAIPGNNGGHNEINNDFVGDNCLNPGECHSNSDRLTNSAISSKLVFLNPILAVVMIIVLQIWWVGIEFSKL